MVQLDCGMKYLFQLFSGATSLYFRFDIKIEIILRDHLK